MPSRRKFLQDIITAGIGAAFNPAKLVNSLATSEPKSHASGLKPEFITELPEGATPKFLDDETAAQLGQKAAEALINAGNRYIVVEDAHHPDVSPRQIAAAAMQTVSTKYGTANSFFGIELDKAKAPLFYLPDGKVNVAAVKQAAKNYPPGYGDVMVQFLASIKKSGKIIYMDEGENQEIAQGIGKLLVQINAAQAAQKDASALEKQMDALELRRLLDSCNIWAKNINAEKGTRTAGVIMGGIKHFSPEYTGRSCDVYETFRKECKLEPMGKIDIVLNLGRIPEPSLDDSTAAQGAVTITVPDEGAKLLLTENRKNLATASTADAASYMALGAINAYFQDTDDTVGMETFNRFLKSFNSTTIPITSQQCKTFSEALLKDLEGAKYQDHFALIFAKAALEKTITLANAPAIKK